MRSSTGSGLRLLLAGLAGATLVGATATVASGVARQTSRGSAPSSLQTPDHLVVSEVMTGGGSASDEFIEIYNPTPAPVSLVDVELVYVSASGATVARKAGWESGSVPPHEHVLAANEAGIFATVADVRYSGGLSATGGSVALRWSGEDAAIDAVGWGSADSDWMEGRAAPTPPAGASLERLPGGDAGSGFDTDDNVTDFVEREDPEPQNSASAPIAAAEPTDPGGTPGPTPSDGSPQPSGSPRPTEPPVSPLPSDRPPTSTPSGAPPSPSPSGTPAPAAMPISGARGAPTGTQVTVRGVALTSSSFSEGGGYLADDTGGIAVLVTGASFARGERLQITGDVSERYHQRTLRVDAADVSRLGTGSDPAPRSVATGEVDEDDEAELVEISGRIVASPTELSAGVAYEVDDGTGAVRLLVLDGTGIDTSEWERDAEVHVRGVVGQRDASGSGTAGYRVQPRSASDVLDVRPPPDPTASARPPGEGPSASPSAAPAGPLVTIAAARGAEPGATVRVRGVVTTDTGRIVDARSAVIQDATGAILLRLPEDGATLTRGALVEVSGERGTKAGMATLRVDVVTDLGQQAEPPPARLASGGLDETHEAQLVVVRGVVASAVRESSTGSVSFDVDDGSGPGRVFAFASTGIDAASVERGSWVEIVGVLGQETSGDRATEGYRVWPRASGDVRVVAPAAPSDNDDGGGDGSGDSAEEDGDAERASASLRSSSRRDAAQDLGGVLRGDGAAAPARATLVTGAWPELGLAGVLWDGKLAVGITGSGDVAPRITDAVPVPPAVVELEGAARPAELGGISWSLLEIPAEAPIRAVGSKPIPPATNLPSGDAVIWARVAGTVASEGSTTAIATSDATVELKYACESPAPDPGTAVTADGLLAMDGGRPLIVVPCAALRLAPSLAAGGRSGAPGSFETGGHADSAPSLSRAGAPPLLPVAGLGIPLLGVLSTLGWRLGTFQRLREAYRSLTERRDEETATPGGVASDTG